MKKVEDRWEAICQICSQVFIWILVIILFPVFLVTVAIVFLWKYGILRIIVKFVKPKLLEQLNSRDAFYATTDRFWENSRSNVGLIVILNGNVSLEKVREDFSAKVLEATEPSSGKKSFSKLTQIPTSFGGYYFWQKANYFLIHEHIRQIDNPIDENELKKFAGTVMTLPFPNKRPLWEILVFSSYNTNCSALVIRMHQTVADPQRLMAMVCRLTNGRLQTHPIPYTNSSTHENPSILQTMIETAQSSKSVYSFCSSLFKTSKSTNPVSNSDDGIISWNTIPEISIRKIMKSQDVQFPAVGVSAFYGVIASPESGIKLSDEPNVPILYPCSSGDSTVDEGTQQHSQLANGYIIVQNYHESNSNSISKLKKINSQIDKCVQNKHPNISRGLLKILSIFPRHILRYVNYRWFRAGTVLFQQFRSEIISASEPQGHDLENNMPLDLISIREHDVLALIPLCGLQWSHSAVTATMIKFQENVTISLMVNSSILNSIEKQISVDYIVQMLPRELDKIFEDEQDEHGFISIPIM